MASPDFSVIVMTAPPPGQGAEAGGPFVKVDSREVLLKSVELFLNRDNIHHIQVMFNHDFLEEAKRKFGPHFSFSGVKLTAGGPRWIDQVIAAKDKITP